MDYNNFREKIYYMNLRDIVGYTLFTLAIYSLLTIFSFFNKSIAYDLIMMYELIVSIILLIFSIHIKNITQKELYAIIQMFLLINCCIILLSLSPEGQFIFLKNFLSNIKYKFGLNFNYINLAISYYIIAKYRTNENNSKIIRIEYLFLLFLNFGQAYLLSIYEIWQLYIIYLAFISLIIILTYVNIRKFKFKSKGKIDLIRFNLFFVAAGFIKIIFLNIDALHSVDNISSVIIQIVLLSTMISVIINIVKESYTYVFEDAIMTSNYLEIINRKIIKNNYKLEETYKKLSDKQMLYKAFLGSLPNPIVIINNNYRITYCNLMFLKEIEKENVREVINRRIDRYIKFSNELDKSQWFDKNSNFFTTTVDLNSKKLEVRFFNLNNGKSEGILIFKDLTEEIKLLNMKQELEDIKVREEIKKNFLSNISHDLKIPINVIYSAIQLESILIDKNDIEKVKSYNDISKENCLTLTKLTNNIIDISKIDTENLELNLKLYNIVEFIEDYLFSLSLYINNSGLDIVFDTNEEEIEIYFDKEMMQRIILNLVSNSIKFTNKGGSILVKVVNFNEYVLIELTDDGIGMSEEFISRAFNKYEKENRDRNNNSEGFGVGLFVVYNLVKAQNGDIEIKSKVGKGTSFYIKLYKKKVV